jgi:hypothetical protein
MVVAPGMGGDASALVVDLDHRRGVTRLDLFVDELILRNA